MNEMSTRTTRIRRMDADFTLPLHIFIKISPDMGKNGV